MKLLSKRCFVLAAVLTTAAAMAQSSSTIDEQFAALDHSLSGTADRLLMAATAQRGSGPTRYASQSDEPQHPAAAPARLPGTRWKVLRTQVEPILKAQGLPTEVLAVVKVESGGRLDALSSAGARGLWQLMPDTARRYGLVVSGAKDERLDPEKATWAATQYLRDLYGLFGDWRLALAAYNAGEDAISRAIARFSTREFDVLSLKRAIPAETRKYVPAVLAEMQLIVGGKELGIVPSVRHRSNSLVYASMESGE
jgi:soluble lytic murein transglycosylase-like protein